MITCAKCGKTNQDHYKFCLGCGAELVREGDAPAGGSAPPIADESTQLGVDAPPNDGAGPTCPQCQHVNPPGNKFCAACGFKLTRAAAPTPAAGSPVAAPMPPAPPTEGAAPPAGGAGGRVVHIIALRADGTEAGRTDLPCDVPNTVGRDSGGIFAGDSYLSPRHATFSLNGAQVAIRDEQSLNGVYRRIARDTPMEMGFGDIFRIGQEIIRVEELQALPPSKDGVERLGSPAKGYVGRLALIIGRDATGNAYPIPEGGLHLGRERGDVLFPEDGYVSGLHCRISYEDNKLWLIDLGSSNGTFLRIGEETPLANGEILLMGQQLFRVSS